MLLQAALACQPNPKSLLGRTASKVWRPSAGHHSHCVCAATYSLANLIACTVTDMSVTTLTLVCNGKVALPQSLIVVQASKQVDA